MNNTWIPHKQLNVDILLGMKRNIRNVTSGALNSILSTCGSGSLPSIIIAYMRLHAV